MATHEQVMKSLKKSAPYLKDAVHREIAAGMKADGLIDDDGAEIHAAAALNHRLRTLNAVSANPTSGHLIKRILAFAQHRRIDLPMDRQIDARDLDKALMAKSVSTADRISLKSWLFQLRLIPA